MRLFRGGKNKGNKSCIKTIATNSLTSKQDNRKEKLEVKLLEVENEIKQILCSDFLYKAYLKTIYKKYLDPMRSVKKLTHKQLIDIAQKTLNDFSDPKLRPFDIEKKSKIQELCRNFFINEKQVAEYMFYASEIALKRLKEISILNLNAQKHTIFIAELEKIVFEE